MADLLADDLPLGLGDRLDRRVGHVNRLDRHRLVEAQPALVDRAVPAFFPPAVANLLGGSLPFRRRLDAERREQVRLLDLVELQPLLRFAAEQLALEPVQLLLQLGDPAKRGLQFPGGFGKPFAEVGDRRRQPRVLLLQNFDSGARQGLGRPSLRRPYSTTSASVKQPFGSVFAGVSPQCPYPRSAPTRSSG